MIPLDFGGNLDSSPNPGIFFKGLFVLGQIVS